MAIIEVVNSPRLAGLPQIRLTVSMLTATAIVVADMVGVGVFTSLGFQVQANSVWLPAAAPLGDRRWRRAVRGVLLWRAHLHVSPLQRRVQSFAPDVPSGRRFPCGLAVGHGRLRSSGCTRSHGFRPVREGDPSGCSAARARTVRHLDSVAGGTTRHPPEQRIPDGLDRSEGRRDPRVPGRRGGSRNTAADLVHPLPHGCVPRDQRTFRDQPRLRDVFVFRLECRDLYRRRNARSAAELAAFPSGRDVDRHRPVRRAQCPLSLHHADRSARRTNRRCGYSG